MLAAQQDNTDHDNGATTVFAGLKLEHCHGGAKVALTVAAAD
jgi:hypothetical protein